MLAQQILLIWSFTFRDKNIVENLHFTRIGIAYQVSSSSLDNLCRYLLFSSVRAIVWQSPTMNSTYTSSAALSKGDSVLYLHTAGSPSCNWQAARATYWKLLFHCIQTGSFCLAEVTRRYAWRIYYLIPCYCFLPPSFYICLLAYFFLFRLPFKLVFQLRRPLFNTCRVGVEPCRT